MGELSKRIRRKLSKNAHNLPTKARPGEPLPGDIKDLQMLIDDGLDPVHAVYAYIQQISSQFAEVASRLPEMAAFADVVGAAEEEYMPSGPPMSPLTGSYFWTWALYDFRIGRTHDTIATCQIESNDIIQLDPDQLDALNKLQTSRMGVYEHVGTASGQVRLRELLTDDEFVCHCASGYLGREGELWYVRLLPTLLPGLADYHIVFTTPYVLIGTTKGDWVNFLRRRLLQFKGDHERHTLHRLMKFGPAKNYWHEFVFKSYHHHQPDAVFLTGIPDVQGSLPHA
jgi:hypothetical protein